MSFVEAIIAKRNGDALDREQIRDFVVGASDGSLPPEQLAAMLMAICCRDMNADETRWLTEEMLRSGEAWELASLRPDAVDKHSTGGVGDTVSLVFAPLVVAAGEPVAMMAGRGLGHSQGTLDKLQAIPGFRCHWDRDGALALIDSCGAAMVAQTDDIAPADGALYGLRDVTGTVPSLPLMVASIMSKKLALGAGTLVLDVKWGRGAFRSTVVEAAELAAALRSVAGGMDVAAEALITDMNQPLAPALGTACEVRAAREVFAGGGSEALREVTVRLAREALLLRGWQSGDADTALARVLEDGSALEAWERLVEAHGGDPDPDRLPKPDRTIEVMAPRGGWISGVAADDLGWVAVVLGAGRRTRSEEIDFGGGVLVHARIGERVDAGQPLATLELGERPVDEVDLLRRTEAAFSISDEAVEAPQLVLGTVADVERQIKRS